MNKELLLSEEKMKQLGYQAVDMLVSHFASLESKPVTRKAGRIELEQKFREPIPLQGSEPGALLSTLDEDVFSNIMHLDHQRFFAFVSSPSNYISVLADFLASGFNVFSGTWLEASAPSQIELVTIDWLAEFFSLPEETRGGLFVSGGSMANLTGLCLAKHHANNDGKVSVIYGSDQTHSSVEKAIKLVGNGSIEFRKVPTSNFEIDCDELTAHIEQDLKSGLKPICIVGNAGTTNTGAVDDFQALKILCDTYDLWFHVDGAYGGVAIVSNSQKAKFSGIEFADSIGIDPHKWFFQPYEVGCLLVKDKSKLKDAFYTLPEYLKDIDINDEEIDYCNHGIQLTRGFRALKVWLSIKSFGLDAFTAAIEHGIQMAEYAEYEVKKHENWQIIAPANLGTISFRYYDNELSPECLNKLNQSIIDKIVDTGYAMISSTVLNGMTVIRLCIINPRTTKKDIEQIIEKLNEIALR